MSAFESIKQGLEEAKAFSKGQGADARVHEIAVPAIDVAEVRAATGLSQRSEEHTSELQSPVPISYAVFCLKKKKKRKKNKQTLVVEHQNI